MCGGDISLAKLFHLGSSCTFIYERASYNFICACSYINGLRGGISISAATATVRELRCPRPRRLAYSTLLRNYLSATLTLLYNVAQFGHICQNVAPTTAHMFHYLHLQRRHWLRNYSARDMVDQPLHISEVALCGLSFVFNTFDKLKRKISPYRHFIKLYGQLNTSAATTKLKKLQPPQRSLSIHFTYPYNYTRLPIKIRHLGFVYDFIYECASTFYRLHEREFIHLHGGVTTSAATASVKKLQLPIHCHLAVSQNPNITLRDFLRFNH